MSFQTPVPIISVIQHIQSNRYVLPAIQREFVWNAAQIERLFDSLLRGYPIGSFLFWEVEAQHVNQFKFYKFMDAYHQRDKRHNEPIELAGNKGVTAILDGQQRLTALNIALRGWYAEKLPYYRWDNDKAFPKRKLYLNLLGEPDTDADLAYEFRMLREKDAEATSGGKHWYPVHQIRQLKSVEDAFYYCVDHSLTHGNNKTASSNLINLWHVIHEKPLVNYYQEESQDLDKVLNIFIRVNSGGTELSYSDMLLSIATAQWNELDARQEINGLMNELNAIGEKFQFGKDFILKASLVLIGLTDVAFKVSNFTRDTMLRIEEEWGSIARALRLTVELLSSWGYNWQTLPSNNAIIPIAYFLHRRGSPANFVQSSQYREERTSIRRWLAVVLLKRVFSGQSDTTLSVIRRVIQENHNGFPVGAIAEALTQTRPMYFTQPELEGVLAYRYGQTYTFTVLSLLYPWLKFDQHFHVDHIFPKGMFTQKQLARRGIPQERWPEWLDRVNDLGNLQLLQGLPNMEKSDQEFEAWLKDTAPAPSDLHSYKVNHLIPDVELSFENFPEFIAAREQLIMQRIADLLDIRLEAPVPEPVFEDEMEYA